MDLREISLFKNITNQELSVITAKTEFIEKTYTKGERIFSHGDVTGDLYYLIEGEITVYRIDANGRRFIIKSFNKPAIFGEIYSYLKEPFDFNAEAEVTSRVLIIKNFKAIFEADISKEFYLAYIDLVSKKCLDLSRTNQITSQATLRQKISHYLIQNAIDDEVSIEFSREEWADKLATTRPSLSRELSNMASDGLIELDDKLIKIVDVATIKSLI